MKSSRTVCSKNPIIDHDKSKVCQNADVQVHAEEDSSALEMANEAAKKVVSAEVAESLKRLKNNRSGV